MIVSAFETLDKMLCGVGGWVRLDEKKRKEIGFFPNIAYENARMGLAATVVRPARNGDFALSATAVRYLKLCMDRNVYHDSWAVLVDEPCKNVLSYENIRALSARLKSPIMGPYGPNWWVGLDFNVRPRVVPPVVRPF